METKHTQGPWRIAEDKTEDGRPIVRGGKHNEAVCYLAINRLLGEKGPSNLESANARLIAAAPDLLEALRDLLDVYLNDQGYLPEVEQKALAAINKAAGK